MSNSIELWDLEEGITHSYPGDIVGREDDSILWDSSAPGKMTIKRHRTDIFTIRSGNICYERCQLGNVRFEEVSTRALKEKVSRQGPRRYSEDEIKRVLDRADEVGGKLAAQEFGLREDRLSKWRKKYGRMIGSGRRAQS